MKIPWLNKKSRKGEGSKTESQKNDERKSIFKINDKSYSKESLSSETKSLILQIKRSEVIIHNQKNRVELLKIAQKIVIEDLRKNLPKKD